MRIRLPDIGAFGRALGLVIVALMLVLATMHFRRGEEQARVSPGAPPARSDPLANEMAQCQALGMAAENDAECKAAWAENRRRFFAPPSEGTPPASTSNPDSDVEAGGR
jgi:conjugative transfer region protein TrbK